MRFIIVHLQTKTLKLNFVFWSKKCNNVSTERVRKRLPAWKWKQFYNYFVRWDSFLPLGSSTTRSVAGDLPLVLKLGFFCQWEVMYESRICTVEWVTYIVTIQTEEYMLATGLHSFSDLWRTCAGLLADES